MSACNIFDGTESECRIGLRGFIRCFPVIILVTVFLTSYLYGEQPGQVIIDPDHPSYLMRKDGSHVFICGPGDPEGFLYRGEIQSDGTRLGDQEAIVSRLMNYGGNCLYVQAVRSHGGDGESNHNPFIDHNPDKGLNSAVLDQWDGWFNALDQHGILIYFFFYDDSSNVWKTGDEIGQREREFITGIVNRFKHLRNLIWIVAEESEEALSYQRAANIAALIRDSDDHHHLIGNHHHSGTSFKSHSPDGAFRHYAMQLNVGPDQVYAGTREALEKTDGYQVIYAENTSTPQDTNGWRKHSWQVAMAGGMPMLLGMDVVSTPIEALHQCRILSEFFEDTDFFRMHPDDRLKLDSITHVLHNPAGSFIAWSDKAQNDGQPGLHGLADGEYDLLWIDCVTGRRVESQTSVRDGVAKLPKPVSIGTEWACYGNRPQRPWQGTSIFPGEEWEIRSPDAFGINEEKLAGFARILGGRGCIIHDGYMIHSWGDVSRSADIASAGKPFYSHLLFRALEQGRLESPDDLVSQFRPCLNELNPELGFKDRKLTFRHLAYQTANLGYSEMPGSAYDYNDFTMGFFWDTLMLHVFDTPWDQAKKQIFENEFLRPMNFEDDLGFPVSGRMRGRLAVSPRDFARLGLLYLNLGEWQGQQLISARHVIQSVSDPLPLTIPRTTALPAEKCPMESIGGGGNQTDHNGGYSWLWWVNGVARDGMRWWKDAPADMFCALGHCGQRGLAVIPSHKLVVSWNNAREIHCDRESGNRAFVSLLEAFEP